MTKLFQDAIDAARALSPDIQDEIARVVMVMTGGEEPVFPMSEEEIASFAVSREQAARGEFASDARMKAIWSKDL